MSSSRPLTSTTAIPRESLPRPATSMPATGADNYTSCVCTENAVLSGIFASRHRKLAGKEKKKDPVLSKTDRPHLPPPAVVSNPVGSRIYKHSCHTCSVHFLTMRGFEQHILKSSAHRPFKLTRDVAEAVGYLNTSEDLVPEKLACDNLGKLSEPTIHKISGWRQSPFCGPEPCKTPNCSCPLFKYAVSQLGVAGSALDLGTLTSLDGAAGSTLHAHAVDVDEDPGNITFSYEQPPPSIATESGDGKAAVQQNKPITTSKIMRTREPNKRFARKENRKAERASRRKDKFASSQKYIMPVLEAYIATDEKLFGQKRFEEISDEARADAKRLQQEAVENWQQEVRPLGTYLTREKNDMDKLAEDIDFFIQGVLSELDMEAEEENRNKTSTKYSNKLFFEDTLENIAIDHEFRLEDQGQERYRKDFGKEQSRQLREIKMEDIVDDIAMDHNQEIGEKAEERRRKNVGTIQNKKLTDIQTDDVVDSLAMDYFQEISEKKQEHQRNTIGRAQGRLFTDAMMLDHVDDFVMDHSYEIGEKEQEYHRKSFGKEQTKKLKLVNGKEADLVESLVMDHLQEVAEKTQERQRRVFGMNQTKMMALVKREADLIDSLAKDRPQGISAQQRSDHKQNKEIIGFEPDGMVSSIIDNKIPRHTTRKEKSDIFLGKYLTIETPVEMRNGETSIKKETSKNYQAIKREGTMALQEQIDGITQENRITPSVSPDLARTRSEPVVKYRAVKPGHSISSTNSNSGISSKPTTKFKTEKTEDDDGCPNVAPIPTKFKVEKTEDDDGCLNVTPIPKKDRRQLRKEANAKFEAMMEQMVKVREEQDKI